MKKQLKLSRISLIFGLILMLVNPILSQTPKEKSLLWEITGNELEKPSYLFGTIHLMCSKDFKMPESVKEAVKKADKLALELDMDDPQMGAKMQQVSINPGRENIKNKLSEEDSKVVDEFFKSNYGQGIAQLGVLKPFVLSSMVIMKMASCDIVQYEMEFVKLAQQQEKEVIGLESIEFQVGLFDDLDYQVQLDALVESIKDKRETEEMLNAMMEAYFSKDIVKIGEIMDEHEEADGFNEKLLDERNENWIPKIEKNSKSASVFYAVGAGHLPGKNGVIAMLRDKGYTVEPIN